MSQNEMIIKYLNDFGSITTYEAFMELGITRLSARISEIKDMGYKLDEEWLTRKNRYNKTVSFKKYILKKN